MVFQKKIIIDSIMSFIATAVGVVAVFFPDLLNMQKEKIKSYSIFLYDKNDLLKFDKYIRENIDKVVNLEVAYCSSSLYDDHNNQKIIGEQGNIDLAYGDEDPFLFISGEIEEVSDSDVFRRKGGSIHFNTGKADSVPILVEIEDKKGNKLQDYVWHYGTIIDKYASYLDKCPNNVPHPSYTENMPIVALLSGTFFITYGDYSERYLSIVLDPMSKKDLKLRNY